MNILENLNDRIRVIDGTPCYGEEDGSLDFENADKIADTLTEFLVKGVGIDTAFWN